MTETECKPRGASSPFSPPTLFTPTSSLPPLERNPADEQGFHTTSKEFTATETGGRSSLYKCRKPPPPPPPRTSEADKNSPMPPAFGSLGLFAPSKTPVIQIRQGSGTQTTCQPPASTFCPRNKKCRGWSIRDVFCRWCQRKPHASVRQSLGGFDMDYLRGSGCGKDRGNFLMTLYIMVKFMYLINAVAQVYFMEQFVGSNCSFYGARVLADLVQGRDWQESGHFPRVTFCDLEAKKLGKNHRYTMQCVLPLNMFLEKIFIFLWFWHLVVIIVTFTSLTNWLRRLFIGRARLKFVRRYLKVMGILPPKLDARDRMRTHQFVDEYLTSDAFFLLLLIGANSGDLLAGDLTSELWCGFLSRNQGKQTPQPGRHACASCRQQAFCSHFSPCAGPTAGTSAYPYYSLHRHHQPLQRSCLCARHDDRAHFCEAAAGQSRQLMPCLPTAPFPPINASAYSSKSYRSEARLFGEKYFPSRSPPRRLSGLLQQLQQQPLAHMQEHMPPACYCCNGSYDGQHQGCKAQGSEGRAALVQITESMEKGSKESLIIQCADDNHEGRSDVNNDNSNQISTNGHRHSASEDIV